MDSGTERSSHGESGEELWRRRAIALTGVLVMVGLVAWSCSGDGEDDADRQRRLREAAGLSTSLPVPSISVPIATPTVTVTTTAKVTVSPRVPRRRAGDKCASRDVVVHLGSKAETYRGKARPRFPISVVNTGKRPCTFGVGPKELKLRITSGPDRIWSSAHCVRGSGSSIRLLKRGIPYTDTITWDRRRSTDGCAGPRPTAQPGTYVAVIKVAGHGPQREIFQLRR